MVLSVWPFLLSYGLFGIFIIRLALGFVFLLWGCQIVFKLGRNETWAKVGGWLTLLVGVFLVLGLFTQPAALAAALLALLALVIKIKSGPALKGGVDFYLLVFAIALALLLLGAGAFAFDLPL